MSKLRVGIWLYNNYSENAGGGFSYYNRLLDLVANHEFENADIILLSDKEYINDKFNCSIVKWKPLPCLRLIRIVKKILSFFPFLYFIKRIIEKKELTNKENLKKELYEKVDIIYYLTPNCKIIDYPFITTIWDLGHKSTYAFPELSMNNILEGRANYHNLIPHKALMIFSESQTGKNELIKYLNINENRIGVVPMFPSVIVNDDIESNKPIEINKNSFFIHYPAQFWAHKNHYNLIIAFKIVIAKIPDIKLILTGSDKGNKIYILQLIEEYELSDHILDLGFVSLEELKWIYLNSKGLVMPTFLGPTNMPLLEAAELHCPVACSDLPGHREELGDYAYYFDPADPLDIADNIIRMIENDSNITDKSYVSQFNIHNSLTAIDKHFLSLKHIRCCWGEKDNIF